MLCFLLLALLWTTVTAALSPSTRAATVQDDGSRPVISHCRSPSMEDFTCWWRPIEGQDNVTYTLQYIRGDLAPQDCPDYMSGGTNSCFFDSKHTQIWEVYCMRVTAHTGSGTLTSDRHCIDVADIVEPDPPFNLSYIMLNESHCGSCRSIMLSWMYPIVTQVREGWITLFYELRYRNLAQPDTWKVKERLREPYVEVLDLPGATYEFMVRCRSANSKHWSRWSESITINIIGRPLSDRMLAFILVASLGVMAFLIIGFGFIPRGKRIKAFLLPPIPKPRIRGLEPILLKNGKIDEINRHFSSFHGYESPQYSMETWYQVSVDACPAAPISFPSHCKPQEAQHVSGPGGQPALQSSCGPAPYCTGAPPPPEPGHAHPELVSVPGMDYSMILNPAPPQPQSHDFYTCVTGVTAGGQLHLDPLKGSPYLELREGKGGQMEKKPEKKMEKKMERQMEALYCDADPSEAATPLLPHSD